MVDVGEQVVSIPLTVEQASFIVSGLRDLADYDADVEGKFFTDEEDNDRRKRIEENLELATYIESIYVQAGA